MLQKKSPTWCSGKEFAANARDERDLGSISGLGSSPAVGDGQLTPSFFPGKFHGREAWVGYSLGGCRELDMTEHTHTYFREKSQCPLMAYKAVLDLASPPPPLWSPLWLSPANLLNTTHGLLVASEPRLCCSHLWPLHWLFPRPQMLFLRQQHGNLCHLQICLNVAFAVRPAWPLGPSALHSCMILPCNLQHITVVAVQWLSHVRLFATPWTVVPQAPLLVGFSRQEDWSGFPFPSPQHILIMHLLCSFYNAHATRQDIFVLSTSII